jgi:hypothetical protein
MKRVAVATMTVARETAALLAWSAFIFAIVVSASERLPI